MAYRPSASTLCSVYASVGLALVYVWSALSDHVFSLRSALPEFLAVNPRVFFLAGICALSVAFAFRPKISRTVDTTLGVLLPFVGATGTACIALATNQSLFPPAMLCITGLLALGVGYCWLVVSYGLLLARSGSISRIVCCLAAALSMEPVVRLAIESAFAQTARAGIAVALPFIAMALLWMVRAMVEREEAEKAAAAPSAAARNSLPTSSLDVAGSCSDAESKPSSALVKTHESPAASMRTHFQGKTGKLFVLLFSTALLLATVRSLSPCGTWDAKFDPAPMTTSPGLVASYAAGVLLFAWFALVKAEDRPELTRFQPAFLLIVLTLFASLLMLFTQGPQSAILYTFMILDDSFAHMLFWASIACTIASTDMIARCVAGLAMSVYSAGSIVWLFLLGDNDTLEAPVMAIAITAIYLLTMIVSHTNSSQDGAEENGEKQAGDAANSTTAERREANRGAGALADRIAASIEERCFEISQDYKLSPRETEVLVLLAQGRTRVYIQDELVLAENTVKTHIGHIYKKLGVGNRQEMLDLVFGKSEEEGAGKIAEAVSPGSMA